MNVLWFSLSPCGSIRRQNVEKFNQGWMISLEDEIKKYPNIKLSVAYYDSKEKESFEFDGVHYYPVPRPFSYNRIIRRINRWISQSYFDKKAVPIFLGIINKVKPDIIHIHGTEEAFVKIVPHIHAIPVVVSIQGLLAPYSYKFFSGIPKDAIRKYEPFKYGISHMSYIDDYNINRYRKSRELQCLSKVSYILGRTFWDKAITGVLNPQRKYFIVNEILRNPFFNVRWKKTAFSNTFTIVSTVSIGIYKGYETLIEAANILKHYTDLNFKWQIIGYDRRHRCASITHKMTGLRPESCNIEFLGLKTAEEMAVILSQADVYCHVSHIENSPNSVCEAMLVGVPTIATFAGGTASLLEDGKEGLLIQDGDPFILAGTVFGLSQNFKQAKFLGENARIRALNRHDPHNVGNELMTVYNTILNHEIQI